MGLDALRKRLFINVLSTPAAPTFVCPHTWAVHAACSSWPCNDLFWTGNSPKYVDNRSELQSQEALDAIQELLCVPFGNAKKATIPIY